MVTLHTFRKSHILRILAATLLFVTALANSASNVMWGVKTPAAHADALLSPVVADPEQNDGELFGIVGRDPYYEYNSAPVNFPKQANKTALEQQAMELAEAGVRWVRIEFFADYDGSVPAGNINYDKYDYFIKTLAPKYNLKVLALLNVGMVAYDGAPVRPAVLNYPPDGKGGDPNDGSNHFIRVFTGRAQEIATHYGTAVSAYEVVNEPNIDYDLWIDTHDSAAEISPERYAALLASTYEAVKSVNSQAQVITGGMLVGSPPEGKNHDEFDYLYQLYVSSWVQRYRDQGYSSRPGWNTVPWDGVALHPYFLDVNEMFALFRDFAQKLRDRGDPQSKLWITEIGAQASPPRSQGDNPTQAEIDQAYFLRTTYTGILNDPGLKSSVAHVFWFKYEDFVPGNYTANYGLVRLRETADGKSYDPSGQVWVHKLSYETYQEIARGGKITDPVDATEAEANNQIYFSETRQAIAPEFTQYWAQNGALERFGYPISRPVPMRGYLSQFFQRAVFEYHPEFAGTPNEVELRLVGDEFTAGQSFDKADSNNVPPDSTYFPQTEHTLGGAFLSYWNANGGLAVFGYPISEELQEVSPTDGQTYTVQYFERNRFEYHPEAAGTPYEVQLGLLGANMLKTNMWWR